MNTAATTTGRWVHFTSADGLFTYKRYAPTATDAEHLVAMLAAMGCTNIEVKEF